MLEEYHVFGSKEQGLMKFPVSRNTLKEAKEKVKKEGRKLPYLGTFSEYYLLGKSRGIAVFIRKDEYCKNKPVSKSLKVSIGGGYHSRQLNSNGIASFTKDKLKAIIKEMDDKDVLQVIPIDNYCEEIE